MSIEINKPPMPPPEKGKCSSCKYFEQYISSWFEDEPFDSSRFVWSYRCTYNAPSSNGWPNVNEFQSCWQYLKKDN